MALRTHRLFTPCLEPGSSPPQPQDGVNSAIIGATRLEQVAENAAAAGVRLSGDLIVKIDALLGDLVDRDPAKTAEMLAVKAAWSRKEA